MSNDTNPVNRLSRAASVLAEQMIALSGARRSDRIVIAGAGQLDLLIAMTRRGFSSLSCRSVTQGPHLPNDKADLILAPALRSAEALVAILRPLGHALCCGGAIIVQIMEPANHGDDARLHHALQEAGFVSLERLGSAEGGTLWRARKHAASLAQAA